jgi:hypothetical protein
MKAAQAPLIDYPRPQRISRATLTGDGARTLLRLLYTIAKVAFASLVAGAILGQFGISSEHLLKLAGTTPERLHELTLLAFAWALPNVTLGAMVIVPIWFLALLFRPPWRSND